MCEGSVIKGASGKHNGLGKKSNRKTKISAERTTSLNLKSSDSFCGPRPSPKSETNLHQLHNSVGKLVNFHEVPACLQFNKHVLSGYRRPLTYTGCAKSLCCVHNETGNIFTHFLGLLLFSYLIVSNSWPQAPVLFYTGVASLGACMLNSVLYHTFMNYTPHYEQWLCLDVLGIFGTFILCQASTIWFGFKCVPSLRLPSLLLYYFVAFVACYKALMSTEMSDRAKYMSALGIVRGVLLVLRVSLRAGSWLTLGLYALMDISGLLGAIVNTSQVPEKWYPGKFDYWLNSHQIMHIFAFAALSFCYLGLNRDYAYYLEQPCEL